MFSYLVYDLDTQRIVDFRLKPWADRFLVFRAALYEEEMKSAPDREDLKRGVTHRDFQHVSFLTFLPPYPDAMQGFVKILTRHQVISDTPKSRKTPPKADRNHSILVRIQQGETVPDLAREYGISEQRIHQILRT